MTTSIHRRVADRSRAFVAAGLRRVGDTAHRIADQLAPVEPSPVRPEPLSTATALGIAFTAVAAMAPLPVPPVPTGDADTDEHNLRLYQTALAEHGQRDQRLRAVGTLLSVVAR